MSIASGGLSTLTVILSEAKDPQFPTKAVILSEAKDP